MPSYAPGLAQILLKKGIFPAVTCPLEPGNQSPNQAINEISQQLMISICCGYYIYRAQYLEK